MHRLIRLIVLLALACGMLTAAPTPAVAQEQEPRAVPGTCTEGTLPSGALSMYCVPSSGWNGELVLWAHGYIAFNEPLDFQHLDFDGLYLPDLTQKLGFAFATTSYRQNGLAILEGTEDMRELVQSFPAATGVTPQRVYMLGASEGGIITALSIERYPQFYDGGLAMCGPIGNFRKQMNYWGDFRVLFDYFFPGIIPGSPVSIPPEVIANWSSVYVPAITSALEANPSAARQLIRTSKAPVDRSDPSTLTNTALNLLWYNVFATNDGVAKLGGNPYDNTTRWYYGSLNDIALNQHVQRIAADPAALQELQKYETSGLITRSLVTLHTTGDEIIPFWHQPLYALKVQPQNVKFASMPAFRYGHCNFRVSEALAAFGLLVHFVRGSQPEGIPPVDLAQVQRDFARAVRAAEPAPR